MHATVELRKQQIVQANIIATHAYEVGLYRSTGRGDPNTWAGQGIPDADLQGLVAHQTALLAEPPDALAAWVEGRASAFDPARDLQPLLAAPLHVTGLAGLPVNVIADDFAHRPNVTPLQAQALASLFQMMLDIHRDGDRLQELFALYVKLGLPVHTAQIGLSARTDEEFLAIARAWTPRLRAAPFDTDDLTVRMQFRKMWNWGRRHTGERDRRTVAAELMAEPDIRPLLPLARALPAQKIAVVGHSFSMEVNWQAPSAFVPFVTEMLRRTNPGVTVRQWAAGGLSLSRPDAAAMVAEARAWRPDRLLFVVLFAKDDDYVALERMTLELRSAGVREVAIFDHLRATRHATMYEESEERMRAVAQRAGLRIVAVRSVLDASPDVDRFLTLDGIHMAEPYHRLMAKQWLRFLVETPLQGAR